MGSGVLELENIPKDQRVYIDESGIDKFVYRPFGRSFLGEIIQGMISGKRYQRESFVAGKVGSRIIAPFCYKGTCNTDLFNFWVEHFLPPYSPDLNPIEVFWANFKRMIREKIKVLKNLSAAINESFLSCMASA